MAHKNVRILTAPKLAQKLGYTERHFLRLITNGTFLVPGQRKTKRGHWRFPPTGALDWWIKSNSKFERHYRVRFKSREEEVRFKKDAEPRGRRGPHSMWRWWFQPLHRLRETINMMLKKEPLWDWDADQFIAVKRDLKPLGEFYKKLEQIDSEIDHEALQRARANAH